MRTFRIALALALCLTMQGCNLGLNALRSGNAPGALNTRGDTRIIASTCMAGFDTCESVVQVEEVTALEAWAVTSKERQNGPYGIPAGEVPITLYIVGFKADCDRAEARLLAMAASRKAPAEGVRSISESCHGPFFFKKDR